MKTFRDDIFVGRNRGEMLKTIKSNLRKGSRKTFKTKLKIGEKLNFKK